MRYVDDYIELYNNGKVKFNQERIDLISYLKKNILGNPELYFDDKQIVDCVKFIDKWYFPLQPFQKFLIAFVFLYRKDDNTAYYRDFLWMMGRGAGKNGLISGLSNYLISELHGIPKYNGSIVANSEDQAKTSVIEIKQAIENSETLQRAFYATNSLIRSRKTQSVLTYRTSNGNTKDGLRDGFVIFDEIHQYADNSNTKVHVSGLGKTADPRVFYIGTDGYVREGFIDGLKKKARKVLTGKADPDVIFPWICKIDDRDEYTQPDMWEKANPMLSKPRSTYAKGLLREIMRQFRDLEENPSDTEEFMTKRMDFPSESMESSVAPYDEIKNTNQPIPKDIAGRQAVAAVDFASTRDFIAAAITAKYGEKLVTIEHQWATKWFVDKYYGYSSHDEGVARPNARIQVPIAKWQDKDLITIVHESTLDPELPLNWINEMQAQFNISTVVMDNYRAQVMRQMFENVGYTVNVIRNPRSVDGLLATIIDDGFPKGRFVWGDNPLLRWNTQNVLVKIDSLGNKHYEKKEPIRRKTDGFQAFEYTLYNLDSISDIDVVGDLDMFAGLKF